MAKRGRKAQPITKEEILNNLYKSKKYDTIIKKIIDFNYSDYDADADTKVAQAKMILDYRLDTELLKTYASKGEANKMVNNVIDSLTMSAEDVALKTAKQEAKQNLKDANLDFDFRQLNKKPATFTATNNMEIDPQEIQSIANAEHVAVEGYYDYGNGYAILKVIVSMEHGSPMPTSVLVSSDVLGRIHNAV